MRARRFPAVAALATAAALAIPTAAFAHSQAYATVTQDGQRVMKTAFELVLEEDIPVDHKNEAVAYARCTNCQAYAVAFSIVLVGDATSVTPTNWAQAINHECTQCEVGAWAKQWVRVGSGEPELSDAGEDKLESVRARVAALNNRKTLTRAEIDAEVARLKAIVDQVLATELSWES